MSDFCKQHSIEMFGFDTEELAGLCSPGNLAPAFCEGCGGRTLVTHLGESVKLNPENGEWRVNPTKTREEMSKITVNVENELKYLPTENLINTFNCGIMEKMIQSWQQANGIQNPIVEVHSISQIYSDTEPNQRYRCSVNLKNNKATYTSTWKSGELQSRDEITKEISAKEYFEEEAKTSQVIRKIRFSFNYMIKDIESIIELDYFGNRDKFLIEIEHSDLETLKFIENNPPFFCGENVTLDSRYKNKNIFKNGFPK